MNISSLAFDDGSGMDSAGQSTLSTNSSDPMDQQAPGPTTEVIIIVVIMFIFSILGIVGNAFAFLIYYRKRDKGTSTIFILSLAVTDFITCLIMIPFTIAIELLLYKLTFQVFCKLFIFLQTYLILLSSFIMVAIGIDRYFCICHPFLRVVTVPRAKVILVILTVVSIAICTVPCIFYSVYQMESYNQTIIIYNSTLPQVHDDHAALGADSNPSNLTSWVASLSDVVLPSNAPFSYGASPRASYASGAGVQATTASSPALYTNGLFLEPDQDFLNSIVGEDAQTVSPPHSPSSLLQAAALTTAAGAGNFLNSTNMSPFSEFNTSSSENASYTIVRAMTRETYTGYCYQSYAILPYKYMTYYQKFHASIFLFEFIILALLYILIYRSILVRRAWKAKRRRMSGYASTVNGRAEETQLTHINAHVNAAGADGAAGVNGGGDAQPNAETGLLNQKTKDPSAGRVSAAMRDRAFYANIRTAAMLFVVTVAFVVSFLPSWFMGLKFFKFNMIVFYMFYINNVINPFIYAFMNKAFRDDLVQLLKGCLRH